MASGFQLFCHFLFLYQLITLHPVPIYFVTFAKITLKIPSFFSFSSQRFCAFILSCLGVRARHVYQTGHQLIYEQILFPLYAWLDRQGRDWLVHWKPQHKLERQAPVPRVDWGQRDRIAVQTTIKNNKAFR